MGLIYWEKPKKLRSTEKHNATYSSDSGVAGTYVPNMSEKDRKKWKGKITQTTTSPQVEIRKDSFVVIVGLDGYTYKYYRRIPKDGHGGSTKGLNMHIAAAGPIQMSFKVWEEFVDVVREARWTLEEIKELQERAKELKKIGHLLKDLPKHSFNKKKICIRCGMSSIYAGAFNRPCSEKSKP